MEVSARMFPWKPVFVPRVTELPTCQKMRHGCKPLITNTLALFAVVRVLTILKMKTLLGLPWPFRVSWPVNWAEESKQYTPGVSVKPPRSWPVKLKSQACPAALL